MAQMTQQPLPSILCPCCNPDGVLLPGSPELVCDGKEVLPWRTAWGGGGDSPQESGRAGKAAVCLVRETSTCPVTRLQGPFLLPSVIALGGGK